LSKKSKTQYVCSNCGALFSSWAGKCSHCNEWSTLVEQINSESENTILQSGRILESSSLKDTVKKDNKRLSSSIKEIDDVLGVVL
jgi:DNA repair protein RadA/Sms